MEQTPAVYYRELIINFIAEILFAFLWIISGNTRQRPSIEKKQTPAVYYHGLTIKSMIAYSLLL